MHRKTFSLASAFAALTALFALATAQSPAQALTYGSVYSYGGVPAGNGTMLSVYVSGSYWMGSSRGSIAITGPAGRINAAITSISFPAPGSAVVTGDLSFAVNGVAVPATVNIQLSNLGRGVISWNVASKIDGSSLWSYAPTALTSGGTIISVQ